jgi:hypothetical protein
LCAPGAVEGGHLAAALDWTESLGLDCRVPIRPDFGEPAAAEDHLNQRGYRRTAKLAMFVRGGGPPEFPEPPGIEVDEIVEESEGFAVTEESLDYPDSESAAARNLVRAGFAPAAFEG